MSRENNWAEAQAEAKARFIDQLLRAFPLEARSRFPPGITLEPQQPPTIAESLRHHFGIPEKVHSTGTDLRFDPKVKLLAHDLGVKTGPRFWFFDFLIAAALDNSRISGPSPRISKRPVEREPRHLRAKYEYLLQANSLRAYLQILTNKKVINDSLLSRSMVSRARNEGNFGKNLEITEFDSIRARLGKLRREFVKLVDGEEFTPAREWVENHTLISPSLESTTMYPWGLSDTEREEFPEWLSVFQRVKKKWMGLPRDSS